tara:strand:- start:1470 stop:2564 length:1095 start_codon:yes stop_codon:yes gene_type:complete
MAESQTVIQREAPEIEAYKLGLMEQAKALAGAPPTAEMLKNLSPKQLGLAGLQQEAIDMATQGLEGGIGGYQQYLADAGAGFDTAGTTLTGALGTLGTGLDTLDSGMGTIDRSETAGGLSTGIFDPSMTEKFMNPYQKAVTEQALAQMNKQFAEQQAGRSAGAIGAGAFGGSRQGVLEGIAQRELGDVSSRRIYEDLARNFGQAQQGAMSSFENQQRRQANQASLLGQLAQQQAGIAGQQASIGSQQAGIGGQQAQQAMQQAGLGELAQNQALKDINLVSQLGGQQQAQRQADEQARLIGERFAFNEPQQRLSFYSDILRGVPSTQIQTLVGGGQQQAPMFQQALGAGITGLGLYGAGNKLGIF